MILRLLESSIVSIVAFVVPVLSHAAILSIGQMNISGGTVDPQGDGSFVQPFQALGPDTNLVGGYIGNGGAGLSSSTPDPDSIVGLQTSSLWLNVYTAPDNIGDDSTPAGTLAGGPVPSGTLDTSAGSISMDLSSWFYNLSNADIHSGTGKNDGVTSATATGTWDPLTGAYILSWTSLGNAPFILPTVWTLEGTASPVPVPAAVWLFGSGLLCLIGMAGRKAA